MPIFFVGTRFFPGRRCPGRDFIHWFLRVVGGRDGPHYLDVFRMYFYRVVVCMPFLQPGLPGERGETKEPSGSGDTDKIAPGHVLRDNEKRMCTELIFVGKYPFVAPTLQKICPVVQEALRIAENIDGSLLQFFFIYLFPGKEGNNDFCHPLHCAGECIGRCSCHIHNTF